MIKWPFAKILFLSILLAAPSFSVGQNSEAEFQKMLREKAAFQETDLAALERGDPVVKVLPAKDKKEIIVYGIVRLGKIQETSIIAFRDSLTQRKNKSMLAGGEFTSPPVINDLDSLNLEKNDFESLQKCRHGDCGLKVSAALIGKLNDLDQNAGDYRSRITEVYRQEIIDFINDYLSRGDVAIERYNSPGRKTDLVQLTRSLISDVPFAGDLSPEFIKYLRNFPDDELQIVDSKFNWAKVNFGLKPMVTITHTLTYDGSSGGRTRFLVGTKQIYASRYVDSSLALSMMVDIAADNTVHRYLIFTDVSRSDALGGLFGGFKRDLVGGEAVEHVKEMLKTARTRLETPPNQENDPGLPPEPAGSIEKGNLVMLYAILVGLVFTAAVLYMFLSRRTRISGR